MKHVSFKEKNKTYLEAGRKYSFLVFPLFENISRIKIKAVHNYHRNNQKKHWLKKGHI